MPDSPREIRWLKRALANLDAEAAFVARDHPAAAARVVEAIASTVELPAQYAPWAALGRPGRVEGTPRVGGPRYSVPGALPRARPRCRNPPRLPWRTQVAEEVLSAFRSRTAPSFFNMLLTAYSLPFR